MSKKQREEQFKKPCENLKQEILTIIYEADWDFEYDPYQVTFFKMLNEGYVAELIAQAVMKAVMKAQRENLNISPQHLQPLLELEA